MKSWVKIIIYLLLFCIFAGLVIVGQKTVGPQYLLMQLVGVFGILVLLYLYNRKYE